MFKRQTLTLIFGDILALVLALWVTLGVRYLETPSAEIFYLHFSPFVPIFIIWVFVYYLAGLYSREIILRKIDFLPRLFRTQALASLIAALIFYLTPFFEITPKTNLFLNLAISFVFLWLWRKFAYSFFNIKGSKTLLVAEGPEADELKNDLIWHPFYGFNIEMSISPSDFEKKFTSDNGGEFMEFIKKNGTSVVIVDFPALESKNISRLFYEAIFKGVNFIDFKDFYENVFLKVPLSLIKESWFSENLRTSNDRFYEVFKRLLDVVVSVFFLGPIIIVSPFVMLAIKLESRGPIFFRQKRVGKNGKVFNLLKFRSTYRTSVPEFRGWEKEDASVYTKSGRFIRKTYLDELPQIINILKGEMSFVGPRPERLEFARELTGRIPFYQVRLLVEPGLTGWAQINMKNDAAAKDAEEKMQYDLYYIKHRSLFLDLRILLKTIATIISRPGR